MEKKFITLVLAYEGDMPEVRLEDKVLGCQVYGLSRGDKIEKRCQLEDQGSDPWSAWLPASEPPANNQTVIVMISSGTIWSGKYIKDRADWIINAMGVCNSVLYWMPVPRLPIC